MLSFLPGPLKGILSFVLFSINTVFWVTVLLLVSFLRLIIPINFWRTFWSRVCIAIANTWIRGNNMIIALLMKVNWKVNLPEDLSMNKWYLVISNHQSWVDILTLQKVYLYRIPFLKFFLKKELIFVPFLGLAWWALEFPFMKRYSKEFIEKNPHLKNKDIEITRKACEKYKTMPTSVMNFVEGTRYSPSKKSRQNNEFTNLLKPKAGGISFVMSSMGDELDKILDTTIFYPQGAKSFWQFLCGEVNEIVVTAKIIPITQHIRGNYIEDTEFSAKFQSWLNEVWQHKDNHIEQVLKKVV
jgi:1-acyl-sn-glycerol-3-phosphate acyltransferase